MDRNYIRIAFVAIVLVAAGCHSGPSLVGKWTSTNNGQSQTLDLSADSKMVASAELPAGATVTVSGTYSLDKDQFAVLANDVVIKMADAAKQKVLDSFMASAKPKMLDQFNKSNNGKLTWKSDDEFVVQGAAGHQQDFKRIKA